MSLDAACSASISLASACSAAVSFDRSVSLLCFVDARSPAAPTSSSLTARVCAARAEMIAVSPWTVARSFLVFARAALTCELRVPHLRRDPLVLLADLVQVLNLVERVLDRARAEDEVERRGLVGLVDVDEAPVQGADRCGVLLLQEVEPVRLEPEERVERVEPPLVQREIGLERLQPKRDVADLRLERADPARVPGDLVAERLLVLLLRRRAAPAARRSSCRSGASGRCRTRAPA